VSMDEYIRNNLNDNEKISYIAHPHWIVFMPGFAIFLLACIILSVSIPIIETMPHKIMGGIIMLVSFGHLIRALIYYVSTEMGVTDQRVIGKYGLISRHTVEISHGRIESVNVSQSVPGRLIGFLRLPEYGTVVIRGIGGTPIHIPNISNPLAFRQAHSRAKYRYALKDASR